MGDVRIRVDGTIRINYGWIFLPTMGYRRILYGGYFCCRNLRLSTVNILTEDMAKQIVALEGARGFFYKEIGKKFLQNGEKSKNFQEYFKISDFFRTNTPPGSL